MSYSPGPPRPPGYPPSASGRATTTRRGGSSSGLVGCGTFIMGFVLALVLGALAYFFLYIYNPNPNQPLPRPPEQAGTPDITATLSESYLNKEIARQLQSRAVRAGPVELSDVVIKVLNNAQIEVTMRAKSGPASFDLTVTEQVSVQGGQVQLVAVGQPRATSGQLPPGINAILDQVNNEFIEPQINQQLTQITINSRNVRLTGLTSSPGLLTVRANIQ